MRACRLVAETGGDPYYRFASARNPAYGITHERQSTACHRLFFRKLHLQYERYTDGGLIFTLQLEKYPLPKPIRPLQNHSSHSPSPESFASSFPFARVVRCGYTLIWTGRPTLTGEKNYILYPSYSPHSHLPQSARNHLNIFIKNTRKFLVLHNTEIYENNK